MPETNISNAERSDLKTQFASGTENYWEVDASMTDGVSDQKETTWQNTNWGTWLGYYRTIPELAAAIDAKARWVIGKGFTADEITTLILDTIKGFGKDTFNSILENAERVMQIGGDSYAEIITNDEGFLINLKPLDPGSMKHVVNRAGQIIRFEQINKIKGKKNKTFQPEEIFYLARNRLADEIHGQSVIPQVENIIKYRNQAMADWDRVMHRNVEPMWIIHLDTDDETKVKNIKRKMDAARGKGENMYIPKGTVEMEQVTIAPNSSLNPLTWIDKLNDYFFQALSVPQIVVGGMGGITDAASKTTYLAFEQNIAEDQLYIMEQVLAQLNLVIKLAFPASLQAGALGSMLKVEERGAEPQEPAAQPNDMQVEMEGRT